MTPITQLPELCALIVTINPQFTGQRQFRSTGGMTDWHRNTGIKTSQMTLKVIAAKAGMLLFLGAAAAAGLDRSQDLAGNGIETTVSK